MHNLLITDTLMPVLIGGGGALSIGLLAFFILSQFQEKVSARDALSQLQEFEVTNDRDKDLLAPLRKRILSPAVASLGKAGSKFNPPNYVQGVKERHFKAGISKVGAVERFLAIRVLGFVLIPFWILAVLFVVPFGGNLIKLVLIAIGVIGLAVVPNSRLNNKVKLRETEIRKALPDTLDLLVISVEAGLGFEQGLDRVVQNVPGELSKEFARMMGEVTAGSSRADALRNLQERVDIEEVRSFVLAMVQADSFGVSIGRVLRGQADEMRIKRRQRAQEKAQKAPVKMMLPMVFCIFPALFIVILGPAFMNIVEEFSL